MSALLWCLPLLEAKLRWILVLNLTRRFVFSVSVTNSIPLVVLLALERPVPVALSLPAPGA